MLLKWLVVVGKVAARRGRSPSGGVATVREGKAAVLARTLLGFCIFCCRAASLWDMYLP